MTNPDRNQIRKTQLTVWWVLWAAFQTSIFIYYNFLTPPNPHQRTFPADSPIWLAAFAPVLVSTIVRWLILPRIQNAHSALPAFVIGIALSEATCFFGIFLFPAHELELVVWSALGIFQFIPIYASRYFKNGE